jgi:hypothetical protein
MLWLQDQHPEVSVVAKLPFHIQNGSATRPIQFLRHPFALSMAPDTITRTCLPSSSSGRPAIRIRASGGNRRHRPSQTNVGTSQKGHIKPANIPLENMATKKRSGAPLFGFNLWKSKPRPDRHTKVWPPSHDSRKLTFELPLSSTTPVHVTRTCVVVRHRWTRPRGTYNSVHGRSMLSPLPFPVGREANEFVGLSLRRVPSVKDC